MKPISRIATLLAVTLLIMALQACASDSAQPQIPQNQFSRQDVPTQTQRPAPTRPQPIAGLLNPTPTHTRESRTNTTGPQDSQGTPGPAPNTQRSGTDPGQNQAAEPGQTTPQNPITEEHTLLQHTYQTMDLDQFALDANHPIPTPNNSRPRNPGSGLRTTFSLEETKTHPYLHLFRGLKRILENPDHRDYGQYVKGDSVDYNYNINDERKPQGYRTDHHPQDPLTKFVYYPWFEPIMDGEINHYKGHILYPALGPYWFGNNSTRGVLADAVVNAFQQAMYPTTSYHPIEWKTERDPERWRTNEELADTPSWTLKQHLTTPYVNEAPRTHFEFLHPELPIIRVTSYSQGDTYLPLTTHHKKSGQLNRTEVPDLLTKMSRDEAATLAEALEWAAGDRYFTGNARSAKSDRKFRDGLRRTEEAIARKRSYDHREILTTFGQAPPKEFFFILENLTPPYAPQSLKQTVLDHLGIRSEADIYDGAKTITNTSFAVSFVIAFQNRWTSFRDHNRWLIRFEEDLKYRLSRHEDRALDWSAGLDLDYHNQHFPDYWHATDYMQHSLIGPVVLQVYESDHLQPGTYAVTPRITHWEAPGPILTRKNHRLEYGLFYREHIEGTETPLLVRPSFKEELSYHTADGGDGETYNLGETTPDGKTLMDGVFHLTPVPTSPNPNYPLPGDVMTNAATRPGTEIWQKYQMDDYSHEW